jgi:hypothetical protein
VAVEGDWVARNGRQAERMSLVRGYEQVYIDLALNPQLACTLLDKSVELKSGQVPRMSGEK